MVSAKSKNDEWRNKKPSGYCLSEEIKRLINTAMVERDRCIVAVLYESGIRVGELLNLRIKDVQMDEQTQEVTLHIPELPVCKTGVRSVLCLEIYGYVEDWLKCHPNPSSTERFMPLSYFAIRKIVKRAYERAKINKPTNVHMLRHSAITQAVHIEMPKVWVMSMVRLLLILLQFDV